MMRRLAVAGAVAGLVVLAGPAASLLAQTTPVPGLLEVVPPPGDGLCVHLNLLIISLNLQLVADGSCPSQQVRAYYGPRRPVHRVRAEPRLARRRHRPPRVWPVIGPLVPAWGQPTAVPARPAPPVAPQAPQAPLAHGAPVAHVVHVAPGLVQARLPSMRAVPAAPPPSAAGPTGPAVQPAPLAPPSASVSPAPGPVHNQAVPAEDPPLPSAPPPLPGAPPLSAVNRTLRVPLETPDLSVQQEVVLGGIAMVTSVIAAFGLPSPPAARD